MQRVWSLITKQYVRTNDKIVWKELAMPIWLISLRQTYFDYDFGSPECVRSLVLHPTPITVGGYVRGRLTYLPQHPKLRHSTSVLAFHGRRQLAEAYAKTVSDNILRPMTWWHAHAGFTIGKESLIASSAITDPSKSRLFRPNYVKPDVRVVEMDLSGVRTGRIWGNSILGEPK